MSLVAPMREANTTSDLTFVLRTPVAQDGVDVWKFVEQIADLDDNSMYCNLLQCTHFAQTSVIARQADGQKSIAGWMSGYVPPESSDTLFVWQICVASSARGSGLGKKLIRSVLARANLGSIKYIQSTITPGNEKSWGLFRALAVDLGADLNQQDHFDKQIHFGGAHDSEVLVTIGPF